MIGHRGAPRLARENTVESFIAAVATGAGGIELDVRRTADGVLVVHHDPVLDDGRAIVDCQSAHLPPYVPTLDRALDACGGAIVDVEIKNLPGEPGFDSTDRIADDVVHALGARPEPPAAWLISSFRRETIDRCRAVDPGIATGWLTFSATTDDDLAWAVAAGHAAIHPCVPAVDRGLIERCHTAGLLVNAWTCNDVARACELASWDIDGICTDVPDVMTGALNG